MKEIIMPNLDTFIKDYEENKYIIDIDYDKPSYIKDSDLIEVIKLIITFPEFKYYIENTGYYEQYYLSYIIFGQLIHYLVECYKNDDIFEIEQILDYIGERFKNQDIDVQTLLQVGFIELFYIFGKILPKILELCPKNIKDNFYEYYSDYLK
ncbi:MAG: hypothetical protein Q8K30_00380 [Candidatus Gracilibacteria bacterium]|nr:hypothetical protein [Candidatus Gracilibacteria bacterium]